jgi:TAT (twin-arginine translocation) pathway-exported protein
MNDQGNERRQFLKMAVASGTAAAVGMPQSGPALAPGAVSIKHFFGSRHRQ